MIMWKTNILNWLSASTDNQKKFEVPIIILKLCSKHIITIQYNMQEVQYHKLGIYMYGVMKIFE